MPSADFGSERVFINFHQFTPIRIFHSAVSLSGFFSYMRNTSTTIAYMSRIYPKEDISYRGKIYNFEYGKPVSCNNPYELLYSEITPDVVDMMEDIILNTKILQIPSVPDPMA
jgi:hypothetical protein